MSRTARMAILLFLALLWTLGTGCATSRGILDVDIPESASPAEGPAFKIVRVTDGRVFEEAPSQPSIPSLKHREEIHDTAITERAIARKRNGYGKALGDILLPEGETVMDLTRGAVVRAMNESGLRVVAEGDPDFADAKPVEVDIQQFWAWMTPGFWTVALEFDSRIRVKTDLGAFRETEEAHGYIRLQSAAAGTGAWQNTINKGIDELNVDLKDKLQRAMAEEAL